MSDLDSFQVLSPGPSSADFIERLLDEYRFLSPREAEALANAKVRLVIAVAAQSADAWDVEMDYLLERGKAAERLLLRLSA